MALKIKEKFVYTSTKIQQEAEGFTRFCISLHQFYEDSLDFQQGSQKLQKTVEGFAKVYLF
jgi:hypothetical protein